jgi:hypothetical protein
VPHPRTLVAALSALAIAAPAAPATPNLDPVATPASSLTDAPATDLHWLEAHGTTHTGAPAADSRAFAQERHYSSYGDPGPISAPAAVPVADPGDGIAPMPFILGVTGALLVGFATGIALHQLHVRRRDATHLAA